MSFTGKSENGGKTSDEYEGDYSKLGRTFWMVRLFHLGNNARYRLHDPLLLVGLIMEETFISRGAVAS